MKTFRANVLICSGTGCAASGTMNIKAALREELKKRGLEEEIRITLTGCNGYCAMGPVMSVYPDGIFYQKLVVEEIPKLVEEHFLKGRPYQKLMFEEPKKKIPIPTMSEIPFFKYQVLRVLRNRGLIDPESLDEYIARDGYQAAAKALTQMTPEEIVRVVKDSGLRGRGGAGFPTGLKWELCLKIKSDMKYVVCNGDEGDPGAFMDRSVMEADPHSVIEGMIICAKAVGSHHGYIYVRAEYPLAVKRLQIAIDQCYEAGLLGKNILGTGFDFDLKIYQGAGAFVCGEETALMRSIEGKRGMPRSKPPFPVHKGLWDKPTVLNNVETFANILSIILNGADWFSSLGTERSKGTKVFALTGKVKNTGLVEVPLGTSLREIIYEIGGGIEGGKAFKAVQTGGPSGGCIPAELLDIEVDYESLAQAGSIMGSGGMVVMDEDNCMVDVAKFFLSFTQAESCGKCVPCRVGTKRLLEILERITSGKGKEGDIELLEELGQDIRTTSLCGLGMTAPNPVLSTIRYFRDEYKAHIKYKRCPSLICKEIISSACQHTCPIGTEASVYTALIAHRRFEEAFHVIRKDNPLAGVCGRVCHHPCELKCKAGDIGKPIAIRALKRFATDYALREKIRVQIQKKGSRQQRVAIIGSGPAGLTAGYFLSLKGYDVTIFEAKPVVGGMLRVAIPKYRLPREILDIDIDTIKNAGVKFKTDTALGRDISINSLFEEGYKAIFIAIGAHKSMELDIPGEDTEGVIPSLKFLEAVNLGKEIKLGRRVGVIGGGNSAIDSARAAHRIEGTEKVTIIYRRTRPEMPAFKEEIDAAIEEGIDIQFLTTPTRILSQNGKLSIVECIRMKLGDIDKSGRARPVPVKGSEFTMDLDTLIVAIGEQPDTSYINRSYGLEISKENTIVVDPETLATSREGVFTGGDAVTGPNTVIHAINAGKMASESIDKYLKGKSLERRYEVKRPSMYIEPVELTDEEIMEAERPEMPRLSPEDRRKNFKEVELGFTEEMAVKEARRCLRCELGTQDGQKAIQEITSLKKESVSIEVES